MVCLGVPPNGYSRAEHQSNILLDVKNSHLGLLSHRLSSVSELVCSGRRVQAYSVEHRE